MESIWILTDERYLQQRMPQALRGWLDAEHVRARTLVVDSVVASVGDGDGGDPWADLRSGDVVVARTRDRFALALLRAAQRPGVTVLTTWESVAAVRNKARAAQTLAAERIPTPRTLLAATPAALRGVPRHRFPLLLKPHLGDNARGIMLVRTPDELDDLVWTDGMVLAQEYVDAGAVDLKLYVAGERVWAVRRPSPLGTVSTDGAVSCEPVDPSRELVDLARDCARAFGLTLLGVDVLETPTGPLVVDVNDFPNYTGVDEAPESIGRLVAGALGVRSAA
ncbi:MAG: ATP-grasp domain-containing protein [Gaiellaceae bacterium]